jgi:MFS family permease
MTTRTDERFFPIVFALMVADVVGSLEASMIIGSLPMVGRTFGDAAAAGWLISGFALVQAAAAAVGGRLGDMHGRRRVLEIVLLISVVGSLLSAISTHLVWIIAGRCLQGVSGAILPLSLGIIRDNASPHRAAFGAGLILGAYAASGGVGFIVGGGLADIGHWRWIFYVSAVLPTVAIVANRIVLPRDATHVGATSRIDYVGTIGLVLAVAGILIGVTLSRDSSWTSVQTIGITGGGVLALLLWIWYEMTHADPLIDLRRLRDRRFLCTVMSFFLVGCGGMQMALVLLSLMQQPIWTGIGLGLSGSLAGVAKLPGNIAGALAGPAGGKIAQHLGGRVTGICGALILTVSWTILYFFNDSLALVIGCAIGSTTGLTIMFVGTPAVIMEATPAADTSQATGFAYLVRAIGMGVGAQLISLMLASSLVSSPQNKSMYPAPEAFQLAMGFVATMSLLAMMLAIAVPKARRAAINHGSLEPAGV